MKLKKLKLKRAKKHDAKGILRLFQEIDQSKSTKDILKSIESGEVYILKRKKKIAAAFSMAVYGVMGVFSFMYVRKLAVDKTFRKKGMGRMILNHIKTLNRRLGISFFFLYSVKQARKFYEKNKLNRLWRFFWWRKK